MLDKAQSLAVPARMLEFDMINLKRESLFYDKIVVVAFDDKEHLIAREKIGSDTTDFLESNGILSFESVRSFMTDEPPEDVTEAEIALVAASKIAFIEEILTTRGPSHLERCRQLHAQSVSRLAALQLQARLCDSYIFPIDYGHRWAIDLAKDAKYDEFESRRYERTFRIDPPTNRWNYYLSQFDSESTVKYSSAMSFIVSGVCIVDEHCSWGDILDFRESLDNRLYLYRMKKKILEISEAHGNANLRLELESEKRKFNKSLRVLKRKNRIGFAKSILSFSADLLPNIVKLKWGDVAEGGIDIVERTLSGIDGMLELESDGMYYLHRVEESFV